MLDGNVLLCQEHDKDRISSEILALL